MRPEASHVLETDRHRAACVLGCHDMLAGGRGDAGLRLRLAAQAGERLGQPRVLDRLRSGLYAGFGLPGLVAHEAGQAQPARPWLLELAHAQEHFSPYLLPLQLPGAPPTLPCAAWLWPAEALPATLPPDSPPAPLPWLPLFSAPARPLPAGVAEVRASLRAPGGQPAAHAVLELLHQGRLLGRGIADERGEVLVAFAYPEAGATLPPLDASPPAPPLPPAALEQAHWTLSLRLRWQAGLRLRRLSPEARPLPELCALLSQAVVSASAGSPPQPLTTALLRHGRPLCLADGAPVFLSP